jgi:pimeloyl-ACP methyl ester carboxylesterase
MISGNPGLIGYYHTFLSLLADKLGSRGAQIQSSSHASEFQIYGHSLGGFELDQPENLDAGKRLFDLEDQICYVQGKLDGFLAGAETKQKVILVGHSVGSYIAMEILRRHRERSDAKARAGADKADFDIVGGIMLFPTVVDIAKSPSGQKLTVSFSPGLRCSCYSTDLRQQLLYFIPQLALVVGLLARVLATLLPGALLRGLIKNVMGSPPDSAVGTTAAFIKSKRGVRQALFVPVSISRHCHISVGRASNGCRHMAADEMRTITSDKWSDDVWGVSTANEPLTRLFFYFGRNDHWVAERTRDEIIELRGRIEGGPTMSVCELGLPHAFCLSEWFATSLATGIGLVLTKNPTGHNDIMAEKVADMIMDIVSA